MASTFEILLQTLQSLKKNIMIDYGAEEISSLYIIRTHSKINYETLIRQKTKGFIVNYELFKIKLIDSIIKKDVKQSTHWYDKWDETVNNLYEEMCVHTEEYFICSTDIISNKINGTVTNSGMLHIVGKIFAEEKKIFKLLISL